MSVIRENIKRILDERASVWERDAKPLADIAATRSFTTEEQGKWEAIDAAQRAYSERIKALEGQLDLESQLLDFADQLGHTSERNGKASDRNGKAGDWIDTNTGRAASLRSNQSFGSAFGQREQVDPDSGKYENLGELTRALTTTGASAVVPVGWESQIIDLARAKSRVIQAGAGVIPMNTKVVNIGRLTGDPTAAFRAEGGSIALSDPTFDNVVLTAQSMSARVKGTREWFEDSDQASRLVQDALAQAIASKIDQVALYGGIITGAGGINLATPPNPRGILATLNAVKPANVLGVGPENGTTQSASGYWNEILDLLFTVRDNNEEPTALIWNSKAGRQYAKATDSTGQPLSRPADVTEKQILVDNNIPSYTLGTNTTATDVFSGDFGQLVIGQRLGLTLQVQNELYSETGEIGIIAHWRGDLAPARPGAFAVYRGLKGA
ncbi:phage major capsid protein [Agromyces badenianii]|uniref:phage major capsid protein n=1 Tax=Agromyces badenianii TaxID=2080742 RepID=UPI000D58F5C6|nr:phage major capsid protein [Agromyces badenianii]PWC04261.1 phage major capsid protein [Agromyces badenianii]